MACKYNLIFVYSRLGFDDILAFFVLPLNFSCVSVNAIQYTTKSSDQNITRLIRWCSSGLYSIIQINFPTLLAIKQIKSGKYTYNVKVIFMRLSQSLLLKCVLSEKELFVKMVIVEVGSWTLLEFFNNSVVNWSFFRQEKKKCWKVKDADT